MASLDHSALIAEEVIDGLKKIYERCILPLEKTYKYDVFFDAPMQEVDFESKPLILVLGQYSTGKTTFIRHLIGRDFPGSRIGPEPTTDKFVAIFHGTEDHVIPGQVLQTNPELPFKGLGKFSNNFLNKFEGSVCASNALKSFMFVDSPGVLSGKKQRNRQYPYEQVVQWFAERASRILLMFDSNKLDISDEFKAVIGGLRRHDEKIRVVLNKADTIAEKELIRVYGALMWALGKVFKTPEVLRVYISSFGTRPINKNNSLFHIFQGDAADLIGELKSLPRQSAMTKINNLLKRARLVKVHAQIIAKLRAELPKFFGKSAKQKQILDQLPDHFRAIARDIGVPPSDFPNLKRFRDILSSEDISKYPKHNPKLFNVLTIALDKSIPQLVRMLNDRNDGTKTSEDNENPFEAPEPLVIPEAAPPRARGVSAVGAVAAMKDVGKLVERKVKKGKDKIKELNERNGRQGSAIRMPPPSVSSKTNLDMMEDNLDDDNFTSISQKAPRSATLTGDRTHKAKLVSIVGSQVTEQPTGPPTIVGDNRVFREASIDEVVKPLKEEGESSEWVVSLVDKTQSDNLFYMQRLMNGKLTGRAARKAFAATGLPNPILNKIWVLVDFKKSNELDADQFALAMYLAKEVKRGLEVPEKLSYNMIPPSHRDT